MRTFGYERAASPVDAVQRVSGEPDAMYLGGGTNVVDLMRQGVYRPGLLVDISGLPLRGVDRRDDGSVVIGAAVSNSDLAADAALRAEYPVLSQAVLAGASGQIRNMATVGGNLLQRTRCLYFNDATKPCNKRQPGSGCPARTGVHRDLAVLGTSEACIATHPSDMAVALALLDARVEVLGADGPRSLAMDEFYRLPGGSPERDTTLRHGDLITGLTLPPATGLTRSSRYRKARDRASFAFALVSVAVAVQTTDGVVGELRLAIGGVAPRPWRARRAEDLLIGGPLTPAAVEAALAVEFQDAEPLPQNAFKIGLATRLAVAELTRIGGVS